MLLDFSQEIITRLVDATSRLDSKIVSATCSNSSPLATQAALQVFGFFLPSPLYVYFS
jgi:hypothetical protein